MNGAPLVLVIRKVSCSWAARPGAYPTHRDEAAVNGAPGVPQCVLTLVRSAEAS
jgi:hypothetical protein